MEINLRRIVSKKLEVFLKTYGNNQRIVTVPNVRKLFLEKKKKKSGNCLKKSGKIGNFSGKLKTILKKKKKGGEKKASKFPTLKRDPRSRVFCTPGIIMTLTQ